MKYTLSNNKVVNISDVELEKSMKLLDISKDEAIEMWLSDHDYETDTEQEELDAKAKKIKIQHGATATDRKKSSKPRTTKTSDAKKALFSALSAFLTEFSKSQGANYSILTENKLFEIEFDGEKFKLDLVQQRKKKN